MYKETRGKFDLERVYPPDSSESGISGPFPPKNLGKQDTEFDTVELERRETRKVGQREEKRTREAGTKMQCSTW